MRRSGDRAGREANAEGAVDRTGPPIFMFEPVRTRLLARLESPASSSPKILAIVAPVGYGKTVLMSTLFTEWRSSGRHCLWFALDDRDVLIDSVIGPLESLLNGRTLAVHPTQALFRGPDPVERRVDALVDLINSHTQPLTIFFDNLHFCSDVLLGRLLDKLAFTTPPFVHLVLSSARELPLDTVRAGLQGLMQSIGPRDLSLSRPEVAEMLGPALCRRIGADGIDILLQRTEGWPAAVRLAHIILSDVEDPHRALMQFTGSDEALAQLLNRHVLQGFSADMRDFLLQLSQLRSFCRELCRHAIAAPGLQDPLSLLIERNVFVIPLDRDGRWYRLHGLFRDFLLREAECSLSAARRQSVLLRAAQWCGGDGDDTSAIEYALASKDAAAAREFLERIAPKAVRDHGHVLQYIEWVDQLHARGQAAGLEAEYWYAWALTFYRRYDAAHQHIGCVAERVEREASSAASADSRDLQRRISILRASLDSLSDRLEDAHRGAALWLAGTHRGADDPFNVAAAYCIETGYLTGAHRFVDARRAIQSAREAAFQARSAYVDSWVSMYAALILVYEGDPAAAWPELMAANAAAGAALGPESGVCGTIAMMAAHCAVERGDSDAARGLLHLGLASSRRHGFLEAAACGLEAAVRLWTGAASDVVQISTLREIASTYAPRLSLMLSCFMVQRLVTLGRLDQAHAEAEHIGLTAPDRQRGRGHASGKLVHVDALIAIARARLLCAAGHFKQAQLAIDDQTRIAKQHHCASGQVELALAAASVAARSGEQVQAVRHVTRAVSLAAPRGLVRPFDDHAETLATVVADTKVGAWGFALPTERMFFLERCRTLQFANPDLAERLGALLEDGAQVPAQMTAREIELLAFIETGLTNQQMADRIDVSLTTVKWHLQNLYRKLGVANRSAALARARIANVLQR